MDNSSYSTLNKTFTVGVLGIFYIGLAIFQGSYTLNLAFVVR